MFKVFTFGFESVRITFHCYTIIGCDRVSYYSRTTLELEPLLTNLDSTLMAYELGNTSAAAVSGDLRT